MALGLAIWSCKPLLFSQEETYAFTWSYHHGEHYNSVRLREDPCQGPAMQVIIKTDANISSANNNAQTKANDPKKSSHRSTYDQASVKLVMAGTGCPDAAIAEHVLGEMDGDVDAAIEYMIAERLAMGTDDVETDPYMDYACNVDEFSEWHDENQAIDQKDEASCSSKDEAAEKPKNSHSTHSKEKSKTKDCSCGSAKKHKASCSLSTAAPSREPPRAKGGQGKGQKGKKQKKKVQAEAAPVKVKQPVAVPDLGALCI